MKLTTNSYGGLRTKQVSMSPAGAAQFVEPNPLATGTGRTGVNKYLSSIEANDDPDLFRAYSLAIPWIARAVAKRYWDVAFATFDVVTIDPAVSPAGEEDAKQAALSVLRNPDPRGEQTTYGEMSGQLVRDFLVLGRCAARTLNNAADEFDTIRPIDPTTLKRNTEWTAEAAEKNPDLPRYWIKKPQGEADVPLTNDDVIVIRSMPSTDRPDGLSPMQALNRFLLAEKDAFRGMHITAKNLQPTGLLKIPDPARGIVEEVESMLKQKLSGKGGIGVVGIPADSDFIRMGTTDLRALGSFDLYDIIVRAVAASFATTTTALNWTRTTLERTADQQADLDDEGAINILKFFAEVWTYRVVRRFPDSWNLEVRYLGLPDESEDVDVVLQKAGGINPYPLKTIMEAAGVPVPEYTEEQAPYYEEARWPDGKGGWLPVSIFQEQVISGVSADTTGATPEPEPTPQDTMNGSPVDGTGQGGTADDSLSGLTTVATNGKKRLTVKAVGDQEREQAAVAWLGEIDAIYQQQYQQALQEAEPAEGDNDDG